MTTDSLLSVAEASRALGVSERTLRRLLRDPEIAAKTLAKDRQTRTGVRRAVLLPAEVIAALSRRLGGAENGGKNPGDTPADLIAVFERLLAEKDERIAELTAALAHEREHGRQQQEALSKVEELLARSERNRPGKRAWFWDRWTRKR